MHTNTEHGVSRGGRLPRTTQHCVASWVEFGPAVNSTCAPAPATTLENHTPVRTCLIHHQQDLTPIVPLLSDIARTWCCQELLCSRRRGQSHAVHLPIQ